MSDNKRKVDVWLYDNPLTADPNDSFGRVRSAGIVNNQGIAERIKKEGSEYQTEAIVEILNRADRICSEVISEGYAVHTDFVHARLGISGSFTNEVYDPKRHSINVVMSPNATVRDNIKGLPVQIMGKANVGPVIIRVTDSLTGEVNATITPNNALTVMGDKIQIEGENKDVGVYFVSIADNSRTKVSQIISNKNKELILMIPALAKGDYHIEVVTQYSGSNAIVKDPRIERLEDILKVV
ncbi:DNA-binding domain-containing protein [Labilibacter marinus]|uniref:DNA-binding domain-containing protein n=1 Tax=Labilibacter marinus TaxID=1477105 RepID=UPI000835A777|nr:DNA-binding domain-containing protein [Labilibacter marinus]